MTIVSKARLQRVYAYVRGACVCSFPLLPLISAWSRYFSFPQNFYSTPPFIFLSHPEIRSHNLSLIRSVPGKAKDGEREGSNRITVLRFQPGSGFTRTIQLAQIEAECAV